LRPADLALKPAKSAGFAKDFIESAIDKMKTYTYNGVTVWFLSTPIQLLALCAATRPGGFFFVKKVLFLRDFPLFFVLGDMI
jgi:hypothetical protein